MNKPTDEQILMALRTPAMTYIVANRISGEWKTRGFDTAFVLRRLKAMEKAGKVCRVPTNYARQICWAIAGQAHHAHAAPKSED